MKELKPLKLKLVYDWLFDRDRNQPKGLLDFFGFNRPSSTKGDLSGKLFVAILQEISQKKMTGKELRETIKEKFEKAKIPVSIQFIDILITKMRLAGIIRRNTRQEPYHYNEDWLLSYYTKIRDLMRKETKEV